MCCSQAKKSSRRGQFGEKGRGWQRHLYPWCVVEAGETECVDSFTYYVVEWAKGSPLRAKNIYEETYTYDHEESGLQLRAMVESFIDWLEARREFIRDRRIFGGENPEGWHGDPVDMAALEKALFPDEAAS